MPSPCVSDRCVTARQSRSRESESLDCNLCECSEKLRPPQCRRRSAVTMSNVTCPRAALRVLATHTLVIGIDKPHSWTCKLGLYWLFSHSPVTGSRAKVSGGACLRSLCGYTSAPFVVSRSDTTIRSPKNHLCASPRDRECRSHRGKVNPGKCGVIMRCLLSQPFRHSTSPARGS